MITRKAEYGIIILTELASHTEGTVVTSREIARRRSIPVNLVVQLLALLKEAGWTSGKRGPSGGIKLGRDPENISLREVIEKIDGPIGITRCLFNPTPCGDKTLCPLREVWQESQQAMLKVLESVSIADLSKTMAGHGCSYPNSLTCPDLPPSPAGGETPPA